MNKKIIAFGDSLTAGAQSPSPDNRFGEPTPYGPMLEKLSGGVLSVGVSGISGEMTREMLARFDRDVLSIKPDAVIILGGTNDLGWDISPKRVFENLSRMYAVSLAAGIRPVAVTIPSIRGFDEAIPQRLVLNKLIAEEAGRKNFPCVDLFSATAEEGIQRLAELYSNDGLHLTTLGYRRLAELLFETVFSEK